MRRLGRRFSGMVRHHVTRVPGDGSTRENRPRHKPTGRTGEEHGLRSWVGVGETVLEGLTSSQGSVLLHPVRVRSTARVRYEPDANGVLRMSGLPAASTSGLDATEPEARAGRDGLPVGLADPQTQPPVVEGPAREVSMRGFTLSESGSVRPPDPVEPGRCIQADP